MQPFGAVAFSCTLRKPNPTRVWTKATSPRCRTSSTADPHKWPASCAGGLVFLAVFASCSSHLLVGNLGWPSLPGRKSTPSSTLGHRDTMALNKLGSTLSSTPQRPTRWSDMFFWRFHLLSGCAVGVLWHSRLLRAVVVAGSFYACTTSAVRLTKRSFDLCEHRANEQGSTSRCSAAFHSLWLRQQACVLLGNSI